MIITLCDSVSYERRRGADHVDTHTQNRCCVCKIFQSLTYGAESVNVWETKTESWLHNTLFVYRRA